MKRPQPAWASLPLGRWLLGGGLLAITIFFFVFSVLIASSRDTTSLENALLQFLGIFAGAGFSWVIGDGSGQAKAEHAMRASARPAFRRTLGLYNSHGRVVGQINELHRELVRISGSDGRIDMRHVSLALNTIKVQVTEQIGTANDAMEDWRDLAPEDVKELEDKAEAQYEAEKETQSKESGQ